MTDLWFPAAAYVCDEPMDTATPYLHSSNDVSTSFENPPRDHCPWAAANSMSPRKQAYSTIMWDAVLRHAKFTTAFLVEASYL